MRRLVLLHTRLHARWLIYIFPPTQVPINPYGKAKKMAEDFILDFSKNSDMAIMILRLVLSILIPFSLNYWLSNSWHILSCYFLSISQMLFVQFTSWSLFFFFSFFFKVFLKCPSVFELTAEDEALNTKLIF